MSAELTVLCGAGIFAIVVLVLSALGVIPKKYRALILAVVVGALSLGAIPLIRKLKKNRLPPQPQTLEALGELTDEEVEKLDTRLEQVLEGAKREDEQIKETLANIDAREANSITLGDDDPDAGSLSRTKLRELRARSRKVQSVS